MPVKLFVGNLSPSTTADALTDLFGEYGRVVEADALGKFGFVHMETMEDAEAAIAGLDGQDYDGANIKVEISQAGKKEKTSRGQAPVTSAKLFVGNLNDSITSEDLREAFSRHGTVKEADAKGKFGFVHMSTPEEAARCLEEMKGAYVGNVPINVEISEEKKRVSRDMPRDSRGGGSSRPPTSGPVKLFVGNMSDSITTDDLKKLFGKSGTVSECITKGRYGFVFMENWDDAQNAVRMCHQYQLKGQTLNVEESQGGGRGGGGGGGGGGGSRYDQGGRYDDFQPRVQRNSRDNTVKIFIGNLTEDTTTDDLVNLFSRFGRVKEADSQACGKFGFIHMLYVEDAERAISELNGSNLHGSRLNVELSQRGDKFSGGGGPDRRGRGGRRDDRPYERSRDPPRDAMAVAEYYGRTGRIPGDDRGMPSSRDPYPSSYSYDRERSGGYDSYRDSRDPYRDYARPAADSYRQSADPYARPPPEAYQSMASKRLEDYDRLASLRQYQQAGMSMDRALDAAAYMSTAASRFADDRFRGNSGGGYSSNGASDPYSQGAMYGSYGTR